MKITIIADSSTRLNAVSAMVNALESYYGDIKTTIRKAEDETVITLEKEEYES